uniref:Uncharacterized protein ORF104 n=1 Tax=Phaeoceros laevis TaxID=37308 RepID=D3J0I5_9EMBR|nr:hypothetical protein PhlaMp12 [Phaeoceros laevis]ACT75299.1 hypothetical protein PhlaMp12 [Phaeoceros laevis]
MLGGCEGKTKKNILIYFGAAFFQPFLRYHRLNALGVFAWLALRRKALHEGFPKEGRSHRAATAFSAVVGRLCKGYSAGKDDDDVNLRRLPPAVLHKVGLSIIPL